MSFHFELNLSETGSKSTIPNRRWIRGCEICERKNIRVWLDENRVWDHLPESEKAGQNGGKGKQKQKKNIL